MSEMRRSLFGIALMLAMAVGGAAPSAAQTPRGIWVTIPVDYMQTWTLTVMNLTDFPLSYTNSVEASGGQRPPFNGNMLDGAPAFPLPAYRTVTWKSNTAPPAYSNPRWNGTLTFVPQGMDPKWTVTLNFAEHWFKPCNNCWDQAGTWLWMTADVNANPDWVDSVPYNISCSYPGSYNSTYNVMTLSGTSIVAELYAPYVHVGGTVSNTSPEVNATLVIRQRWPHTPHESFYDDSILMPCLDYQDNNGAW